MQDLNLSQEFTVGYTPSNEGVKPKKEPHDLQGVDLTEEKGKGSYQFYGKRRNPKKLLWTSQKAGLSRFKNW